MRTERYGEAVWSTTTPAVCAAIRLAPCPLGPRPSGRTQTIVHYGRGARVRGEGTEMAERLRSGCGRGQGATRSSLSELNVGEAWQHVHHCNAHARSGAHADVRTVRACEGSGSSRLQVGSAPTIPKFRASDSNATRTRFPPHRIGTAPGPSVHSTQIRARAHRQLSLAVRVQESLTFGVGRLDAPCESALFAVGGHAQR